MFRYYQIFFKMIFVFSLLILLTVYFMEYYWHMIPCELCRYERLPYFLLLIVCYIGYFMSKLRKISSLLVVLFCLLGVGMSFFHVGVENHWFNYNSSCTSQSFPEAISLEEMKTHILSKDLVPCDSSQYSLLWVTMAGWNFIAITVLFVFSFIFTLSLLRTTRYDKF